jgi:hypothetical protein
MTAVRRYVHDLQIGFIPAVDGVQYQIKPIIEYGMSAVSTLLDRRQRIQNRFDILLVPVIIRTGFNQ